MRVRECKPGKRVIYRPMDTDLVGYRATVAEPPQKLPGGLWVTNLREVEAAFRKKYAPASTSAWVAAVPLRCLSPDQSLHDPAATEPRKPAGSRRKHRKTWTTVDGEKVVCR
jgi:hypothetical protein